MKKVLIIFLTLAMSVNATEYINLDTATMCRNTLDLARTTQRSMEWACTYQSATRDGKTITLSGKICIPKGEIQGIILLPHYTVTSNKEIPSERKSGEDKTLKRQYIIVMPDYIGYGISAQDEHGQPRWHPYLDAEINARSTVDMLLAAQGFLNRIDRHPKNDSLIVVGFSQGAQTAIATLKILEEEHPNIVIKCCYAGSGPYDVAATYDYNIETDKTGIAYPIPMFILGTSAAYNLDLQPQYFFTDEGMEKYPIVMSQQYTITELTLFKMTGHKVSKYLSANGMDKTKPETAKFYKGLQQSSIITICGTDTIFPNWTPKTHIVLMHSTNDDAVPYINAEHLRAFLHAKHASAEYDFGEYGNHFFSMLRFRSRLTADLMK